MLLKGLDLIFGAGIIVSTQDNNVAYIHLLVLKDVVAELVDEELASKPSLSEAEKNATIVISLKTFTIRLSRIVPQPENIEHLFL